MSTLFLKDRIKITDITEEDSHIFFLVLPSVSIILGEEISDKLRDQDCPYIVGLVSLHLNLFPKDKIFP